MKPILSLIIPVYNVEKYIEACLGSVFSQLPKNVEVLLVDDGSPDDSMKIVRDKFSHWISSGQMTLLEQSNMGPGAARNTGLRRARGAFIAFLDSDDVILEGYFLELFECLQLDAVDVVEFGFKRFRTLSNITEAPYRSLYKFKGMKDLADVREEVFAACCWYPFTRVYRSERIKNCPFPEGTHYEDLMTIPLIYLQDLTVFFIDKPLLGYRYNPSSITSLHTARQLNEKFGFYKSIPLDSSCNASKILKITTARGIVFFYSELNAPSFPIDEMIGEIGRIRLSSRARRKLQAPDRFFYLFPNLYTFLDRFRVPLKIAMSKYRSIFRPISLKL